MQLGINMVGRLFNRECQAAAPGTAVRSLCSSQSHAHPSTDARIAYSYRRLTSTWALARI